MKKLKHFIIYSFLLTGLCICLYYLFCAYPYTNFSLGMIKGLPIAATSFFVIGAVLLIIYINKKDK